jgi:hypothetical protein
MTAQVPLEDLHSSGCRPGSRFRKARPSIPMESVVPNPFLAKNLYWSKLMQILVAEGDAALPAFTKKGLQSEPDAVDAAADGEQAHAVGGTGATRWCPI